MQPPQNVSALPVEVVGIGAATLDDFWLVPEFSNAEDVFQALNFTQMGGGPVATALCVLGLLGHTPSLIDTVGDDEIGSLILTGLQRPGVSVSDCQKVQGIRSARAVVLVRAKDGARQIRYLPANGAEPVWNESLQQRVRSAKLLHLNGRHEQTARLAAAAAESGGACKISFDGGAGRYRSSLRYLVLASHIRILSIDFAREFCGVQAIPDIVQCLQQDGRAELIVVTDGVRGSYVAGTSGPCFHQAAYPAANLVDTTGCGDVYHGAFLHGWLCGWSPRDCSDFASRMAAQNAEGLGGRFVCEKLALERTHKL